jgi:hypothetical protein
MTKLSLQQTLDGKWEDGSRPKDLFAKYVARDPSAYVDEIVDGLRSSTKKVQAGCAELASLLSEVEPQHLYPHLDLFHNNLRAKEPILRWEAVCTIGNLSAIDDKGKTRRSVDTLVTHLQDKSIVLQGHAVRALARISQAFPDLAPSILEALLVARDHFPGNRIGYVVEAMTSFASHKPLLPKIKAFVEPLTASDNKAVASKARKVIKHIASLPGKRRG